VSAAPFSKSPAQERERKSKMTDTVENFDDEKRSDEVAEQAVVAEAESASSEQASAEETDEG
jgi:hypothetical protein